MAEEEKEKVVSAQIGGGSVGYGYGERQPADDGATDNRGCYRSVVVDSGPLIRLAGTAAGLWRRAGTFYTVPGVISEVRDAKAREHLRNLPFELVVREASPEGIHAASDFARRTGDYGSLSRVDLQVLGLLYDLEREASPGGDMSHVRTVPKRAIGLGPISVLGGGSAAAKQKPPSVGSPVEAEHAPPSSPDEWEEDTEKEDEEEEDIESSSEDDDSDGDGSANSAEGDCRASVGFKSKSWAEVVDPTAAKSDSGGFLAATLKQPAVFEGAVSTAFGRMNLRDTVSTPSDGEVSGQFSDAEEGEDSVDVVDGPTATEEAADAVAKELKLDFPSLAAASTVPFDDGAALDGPLQGSADGEDRLERLWRRREAEEARKQQSLRPVSKSGKLYNSFRKYGDLMKPRPGPRDGLLDARSEAPLPGITVESSTTADSVKERGTNNQSRIMGGTAVAGQGADVEDDGEGWISSTAEIWAKKASGALDPSKSGPSLARSWALTGPPPHERSACATTDFAMQNVILQMNLELLSVDGLRIRKLKSFVTRCGACYKVYIGSVSTAPLGKRLFCDKCGSDMMQRIAASVDGKTGRIRLHLSKRYKHNLRGTKFSLPKPGTGDRFKGDLLLREDQLLMGAWNQKVKMASGGKSRSSAQSMFGKDLATNMGCNASAVDDDIRVGFGRRNPNAVKGRERRGKRKKTADKACGLRRY